MQVIKDKFVILSKIGQGGYGIVFKAFHMESKNLVAIKICPKKYITQDSQVYPLDGINKTIPLEAFVMMISKHEGIISLYSCLEDDDNWYYVMELPSCPWSPKITPIRPSMEFAEANGNVQIQAITSIDKLDNDKPFDLFEIVENNHPLPITRIKSIFKQTVQAVLYLHSKNVIHGDLKDENIIVDSKDTIKIIDFGSSYFAKPGEKVSVKSGTVQYLPPEVLQSQVCDPRKVDVWCLGVILYVMFNGKLPFRSKIETCTLNIFYDLPAFTAEDKLLDLLLKKNPDERIAATNILNHEWFGNELEPELIPLDGAFAAVKSY